MQQHAAKENDKDEDDDNHCDIGDTDAKGVTLLASSETHAGRVHSPCTWNPPHGDDPACQSTLAA